MNKYQRLEGLSRVIKDVARQFEDVAYSINDQILDKYADGSLDEMSEEDALKMWESLTDVWASITLAKNKLVNVEKNM